jgi:uncharacterized protein (UPF0218 family)
LGSLRMPNHLREELSSEAYGILLRGSPAENASKVKEIIASRKPPKVIVVGDFTLKALLNVGCVPDVGIFDRLTKRVPCEFPDLEAETVRNPAGEITDEAIVSIKRALLPKQRLKVMLSIEGEEDLLALPAIAYAPRGSLVIYGIPNRGMLVVTANSATKKKIATMISQFKKID